MTKLYPFSRRNHAHDIEFYRNRIKNVLYAMDSGDIPYDARRYNRLETMLNGPLEDLYNAMYFNSSDGIVCYLTGSQIALAKRIIVWAHEQRAAACVEAGRLDLVKYC